MAVQHHISWSQKMSDRKQMALKNFAIASLGILLILQAVMVNDLSKKLTEARRAKVVHTYYQECPGCGNGFWTTPTDGKLPTPVEAPCPMCPMSEEEFEQLQERLIEEMGEMELPKDLEKRLDEIDA